MQEQYVCKACGAIAGQIFCVTVGEAAAHAKASTGSSSSSVAAARVSTAHPSAISAEAKMATGLDILQRAYDAVVQHAMTLYRLCRRPGGSAIDIVSVGTGSSGGGAGTASAAEEAAYCVCAAVMATEPQLWASLVRRAQLLRPRKPSFLFVSPVTVPPVVVKDIEKFFRRSRCLMRCAAAPTVFPSGTPAEAAPSANAAPPSLACGEVAALVPTVSASASSSATTTSATATSPVGLPARQAEAVAACFFFKTMSEAERLRRRDVFEVQVELPVACCSVGASASATTSTTPAASAMTAAGASAIAGGAGVVVPSSSSKLAGAAAGATAADANELAGGLGKPERQPGFLAAARGAATPATAPGGTGRSLHTRPKRSAASLLPSFSSAPSMLFTDGLSGWGVQQVSGSVCMNPSPLSSTLTPASVDGAEGGAEAFGWPCGVSSGSSSRSRSSSPRDRDTGARKAQGRRPSTVKDDAAPGQQAGGADAVLARLYALALSVEDPAAGEPPHAEGAMQPHQQGNDDIDQRRAGGATASVKGSHALFSAAISPAMLSSESGLSLVALSAAVTHACDALHWGRLQALVRYPLLFRAILPPAEASATVALQGGGEALTVEAMTRMSGCLGMAYTTATVLPSTATALSDSTAGSRDASSPSPASLISLMSSLYGPAGSIFSPARLHTSSPQLLFPSPPSLVTDGFLWIRLLICSAWLLVYADGLAGNDKAASVEQAQCATGSRGCSDGVWPRVRPTPAVRAIVAYCTAVVREAREMSAGVAAAAHSGHGTLSGTVCCPVCDDLVKEQQSKLRWSTLRDDHAALRAHVRAVLESNCEDSDEAEIAAALTGDLACEGRGRRIATQVLSGSEGAPCRVAALQQRWGAYIMRAGASATVSHAASAADARDTAGDDREEAATAEGTLWTALTQRVAAATDFCVFLSAHPTESTASPSLAAPSATCGRPKRPRAEYDEGAASQAIHRRRRQERQNCAQHAVDSGGSGDARKAEDEGMAVPTRHHSSGRLSGLQQGSSPCHTPGSDNDEWGDDCRSRAKKASRAGVALQGSRQAVEEAEEWGRLLCRCGWANAAPPSGATSPRIYEEWASSLFLPSAFPTPQQAATLRRRLCRYSLTDIVRKLVLGRGGSWERYAQLLFGGDVCTDSTALPSCSPPVVEVSAAATADAPPPPMASPSLPYSSPRPRAPSLSLLEEAQVDADCVYVSYTHANPRATHISSPPRQLVDTEQATPRRSLGLALSPQLFCGTASTNVDAAAASQRCAATPAGKGALPSIPLLVSPLTRRHQMAAASGVVAAPPLASPTDVGADATSSVPDGVSNARAPCVRGQDTSSRVSVAAPLEQLRAQQAALYALLHFRPRLPPLREEDAVLECASCFSLFHQECIAPVQRNFIGQAFLCHTCRLRWARPYAAAGCGFVHQVPERPHDARVAGGGCAANLR
ncbi:hypothetical protein JIQ42_07753 [Leishmania sp. Namibia]|uniref:hypothetical protein n=1 Tax=Leishmania sp. Namibia TaxID=2802991 RepID=UPI001B44B7C9|nr:hypothetical protein JIQ42_07753 [Leishmania sp. Namibia]